MTQQAPFSVATLGFDERERVMFRDTFRISEHCTPTFRTLIKDARALPHIVIVNADQPESVARWESFRRANEGKGKLSTLMWSSQPQAISSKYVLGRPASLSQLFAVLERIVAEDHGYQKPQDASVTQSLLCLSSTEPPREPEVAKPTPVTTAPAESKAEESPVATATPPAAAPAAAAEEIAVILEPPTPAPSAPPERPQPAPATAAAAVATSLPQPSTRPRGSSAPQSRFLVVDDSLPVRIQMKEALKTYAKTIDFAHSGEEAMFLIDNCKYDVIFLDVILPGKDGYEVCRYIRSHALQRQTPVIMLTGNSSPADRVKGKLAGCDTYLIKPVRASVLSEIIGEFTKSSAVA